MSSFLLKHPPVLGSGLSRSFLRRPDGLYGLPWTVSALRRCYRARVTAGQNKIHIASVFTLSLSGEAVGISGPSSSAADSCG